MAALAAVQESSMCDYSLMHIASRPAQVGDRLVSTSFHASVSRGFAAVGEPNVAVCLMPGTEIAFEADIRTDNFPIGEVTNHGARVARFRQINKDQQYMHHDALELPDGRIVLLTRLIAGQHASVLQLPAQPQTEAEVQKQTRVEPVA
jgi:hypothetical protein